MKITIRLILLLFPFAGFAQNVVPSNGNVGIGTANPSVKLDVKGKMNVDSSLIVKDSVTFESTLRVGDDGHFEGELEVTGNALFHNEITVMGYTHLQSDLILGANVNLMSMQASTGKSRIIGVDDNGNLVAIQSVLSSTQNKIEINGDATISGLLNSNGISTGAILPAAGDSIIQFGANTIYYNSYQNMLYADQNSTTGVFGMGMGNQTYGKGLNSLAFGEYVRAFGDYNFAMGRRIASPAGTENTFTFGTGNGNTWQDPLINNISNSFLVAFNNDKTFYVGPDAGANQTAGSGVSFGVGIGTTYVPLDFNLAVEGSAMFEDLWVKPKVDWPDYVFYSDYILLSLSELESFILTEGHLPKLPVAESVESDGVSVTDLQPILVEKIEELTLYIIQLEKRIKELELLQNVTE